jgi:secondary thiamine-phosphate synthase enzyme
MIFEETIKTSGSQSFIDITHLVRKAVRDSRVKDAHIIVSVPHTTAAITVNENADPDVVTDLIRRFEKVFPTNDPQDRHAEGNSHAHMKSSLFGCSHSFIVNNGEIVLGTWQGIYFCEFDGPRTRKVIISIL